MEKLTIGIYILPNKLNIQILTAFNSIKKIILKLYWSFFQWVKHCYQFIHKAIISIRDLKQQTNVGRF